MVHHLVALHPPQIEQRAALILELLQRPREALGEPPHRRLRVRCGVAVEQVVEPADLLQWRRVAEEEGAIVLEMRTSASKPRRRSSSTSSEIGSGKCEADAGG